ncbi:hypothetical protein NCCP2716_26850 [Sporosarcina sp. NCCP-2716]|uniref:hypothetical protein n=1 Tax=Sporosarcina sp. NCCP-2716 TaxID=2943679 RepID=UPI00203E6875|nr:hypothetical protein [Sporosarcina sp. NCCP-2716]GKV70187.1 hypothetical protein NCCP2716_26850 [Sporosarcina sp. NCCP-2716]
MKRILIIGGVLTILLLGGCAEKAASGKSPLGNKPPRVDIMIGGERYETKLGTYCWSTKTSGICVDTAGAVDMMKGETPIEVQPGELLELVMDETPAPDEQHLVQSLDAARQTDIPLNGSAFTVPEEAGVYYYDYSVWWHEKENPEVSLGDAHYAFAIEVK